MYKVIEELTVKPPESIGMEPQIKGFLRDETLNYIRNVVAEYDMDFNSYLMLLGRFGFHICSDLEQSVNIAIFEDKCFTVTPVLPIRKITKVNSEVDKLVKNLQELVYNSGDIDCLLGDMKFSYGYFKDKNSDEVTVTVNSNSICIRYRDISKYDMTKVNPVVVRFPHGTDFNFGGAETLKQLSKNGFSLAYNQLDEHTSEILLTAPEEGITFKPTTYTVNINSISFLRDIKNQYELLGLEVPDFSKTTFSNYEYLCINAVRFIGDTLANIAAHNYRDYTSIYIVEYEGLSVPALIPEGYLGNLKLEG